MDFKERIKIAVNAMKEKYNYKPSIFIKMIYDHGEVEAVRRLVNSTTIPEGYTRLWELSALNLSVEAIILEKEWEDLFSEEDRTKARKRLTDYSYKF